MLQQQRKNCRGVNFFPNEAPYKHSLTLDRLTFCTVSFLLVAEAGNF